MRATITDSDSTVLELDEAVVNALWPRYGVVSLPGSTVGHWWAEDKDEAVVLKDIAVIALIIDVLKTLVRERYPLSFCKPHAPGTVLRDEKAHWTVFRLLSPESVAGLPICGGPTELQAWHAAYASITQKEAV